MADPCSQPPPYDLLQRLLDRTPAMLAYWDADGRNVMANQAFRRWLGLDPAAIRGMHLRQVLGEDVYAQSLPHVQGVLAGEEQHFDRTMTDATGRARRTQVSYVPDVVGGVTAGFFALVTDVTARFEGEQAAAGAAAELRSLARNLPDAFVMLFDADLRFRVADGHGLRTFGFTPQEVEGRTLSDVFPERADELEPRYRAALRGSTSRWRREVGDRSYALTVAPVTAGDGEVQAGIVVGVDVTEERRVTAARAALQSLTLAAARRAPLQELVDLVAESALALLRADRTAVARFEGTRIRLIATRPEPRTPGDLLPNDGTTAVSLVATTGVSSILEMPPVTQAGGLLAYMRLNVSIAAPIRVGDHLWGAVAVGSRGDFGDRDEILQLLEEFAGLVSLSISNNQAWDALDRLARLDPLTSLPNRRVFDERLRAEVERAARTGASLGLLVLDLDHFKEVNDRYGHQTGDAVLAEVGRRLSSTARGYELVARLGGEEFAVVTAEPHDIAAVAERFHRAVGAHAFAQDLTVTTSVGAATAAGDVDLDQLFRRADRALYAAKAAGRNRVVVDDPPGVHALSH